MAGCMWFYAHYILVPYQRADASRHSRPRGNLSDLYPRWLGARELILYHRDPYSQEVTREIQTGYYGRPLNPALPGDPKDQQAFAYPVYVAFLLAPIIDIPFSIVQEASRWILAVVVVFTAFFWLRASQWFLSPGLVGIVLILTLGSLPVVQGLKLQQLSLLVSGFIAVSIVLINRGRLFAAGILLAIATIKPQLVVPLLGWLLLWALSNWKMRKGLILGFALAISVLLIGAQWILPGWIAEFFAAVSAYRQYTGNSGSILTMFTSPVLAVALTILIVLGMTTIGWRVRNESADSQNFVLMCSLVLATTLVIIPTTALYNQVLLLPAIFLLVRNRNFFFTGHSVLRLTTAVAGLAILWPWLIAIILAVLSLIRPRIDVLNAWPIPLWTTFAIPPLVVVLTTSLLVSRLPGKTLKPTVFESSRMNLS